MSGQRPFKQGQQVEIVGPQADPDLGTICLIQSTFFWPDIISVLLPRRPGQMCSLRWVSPGNLRLVQTETIPASA